MEVTQFTYFQQVGGLDCRPVSAEITYGLERLAMYVQGIDNGFDLAYNTMNRQSPDFMSWGDVYHQNEVEQSGYNFEHATTDALFQHFKDAEAESQKLLSRKVGRSAAHENWCHVLPAYEQCIRASHTFNLLDARGVISVTERQAYIGRVRALAKECAQAWIESPQGMTLGAGQSGMGR
jgi:glycyl-tRNA synthetase alpha chain